jgi:hypothetical protein
MELVWEGELAVSGRTFDVGKAWKLVPLTTVSEDVDEAIKMREDDVTRAVDEDEARGNFLMVSFLTSYFSKYRFLVGSLRFTQRWS